jgi:hypothetical protein
MKAQQKKENFFFDNIYYIFIEETSKDKISYNYITHIQTELWQASFSNFFKKAYSIVGGNINQYILPNITLILNKNQTRTYETDIDFLKILILISDNNIKEIEKSAQTISTPCLFIIPIFFLIIIMLNFLFCIGDWYKKL